MSSLPEVTAGSEEGFVDLNFLAQNSATDAHGVTTVEAIGQYQGVEVGFSVRIGAVWNEQNIKEGLTVRWGKVQVSPRGAMSDRLARLLDKLYGVQSGATTMTDTGEITAVALGGNPQEPFDSQLKMKLFLFEKGPDDRYCEVYLNVDLAAKRVELNEKDPGYRRALVSALSRNAG